MSRRSYQRGLSQSAYITWVKDLEDKPGSTTSAEALSDQSYLLDSNQNNELLIVLVAFFELMENDEHGEEWHFKLPMAIMNIIAVMPGYVTPQNPADNTTVATISHFPFFLK